MPTPTPVAETGGGDLGTDLLRRPGQGLVRRSIAAAAQIGVDVLDIWDVNVGE